MRRHYIYGNRWSEVGQDEEARKYAWDALEIRKRLSEKNPDRHEPDYTTSLSNYAIFLSEAGQDEEARKYAWDALEIRKRLSEKNPDRHDPDYTTSLSTYAIFLSEAGQDEEARKYAWDALEIRKHLAQKNPHRFAVNLFSSICSNHFLEWLSNDVDKDPNWIAFGRNLGVIPQHRRSELLLDKLLCEACRSTKDRAACT
ncbi:MAG: tetratricopeptide repeat protein [Nitrosomonas sp.]|nr:tetratricopeptide repeat protein [Nitrosomonas sp.]